MTIEKVTLQDAEVLLEIYAPYVHNTAISFEYEVPTVTEFRDRIRKISSKYPYLKAFQEGEVVGYAYANTFKGIQAYDWSVETTVYVKKDCKRMGIGRALYNQLEKSLKSMGILNMNACIAVPVCEDPYLSDDSFYFHSNLGFSIVGRFHNSGYKFDRWYDMIWMEKIIGNHEMEPFEVRFGQWTI